MKRIIIVGIMILMFVSTIFAAPVVTKFSANISEIRIPPEVDYESLKKKKKITVKLPAIVFKKPLIIPDVRKARKTEYEEINFLIEYTKANINGTPEVMASFWLPEERAEKLALFRDTETLSKNRDYFRENPGLHILGIIYQKKTLSVLSPLTDVMAVGITMKKIGSQYYLTDHPTNDLELAVVEAAMKDKRLTSAVL